MKKIDLRSDTVTQPTDDMRKAMAAAEVGDDVFGEDPSVNRLQERMAGLLGKEQALFVASGTMGNLVSILTHTRPGDEVILEAQSHPFHYEFAGAAAFGGVQFFPVPGNHGILDAEDVAPAIRPDDGHHSPTRLICLENTHNRGGGKVYPLEKIERIRALAEQHHLVMHMDGARLFNATVATGIPPADYCAPFDSVSVCLSKGLGCPVGSVIAGPADWVKEARRFRKRLGGGMRQAGILAAAGLYALDHHIDQLAEDHRRAKQLANALSQIPLFEFTPSSVETNIIVLPIHDPETTPAEVVSKLQNEGVLCVPFGPREIRLVTHLGITDGDVARVIEIFNKLFAGQT